MDAIVIELIKIAPSILWLLFVVVLIASFYRPIKNDLLPRLTSFEAAGIKFAVIRESIKAAVELADEINRANNLKYEKWNIVIDPNAAEKAENRAKANHTVFKNTFFLWIDDMPEFNHNERKMFKLLGVDFDIATSSEQALSMLKNASYDVVISDIARGEDPMAGVKLLEKHPDCFDQNLIFYVGRLVSNQKPEGAFGITNRPDELLHYSMDILERKKY